MSHIVLMESAADGETNDWLEPVSDEQYQLAHGQLNR
jgi:hypothetical protein